jgi:hypothetical protein
MRKAASPPGCARCGAGAGCSAIRYQSLQDVFEAFGHLKLSSSTLETTQGEMAGFFRHLPYKWYFQKVAFVGDWLKVCPWVVSRMVNCLDEEP